jgi:hypothetical protein
MRAARSGMLPKCTNHVWSTLGLDALERVISTSAQTLFYMGRWGRSTVQSASVQERYLNVHEKRNLLPVCPRWLGFHLALKEQFSVLLTRRGCQ